MEIKELQFTKMEGLGNDYIYLDAVRGPVPSDIPSLSVRMSDRHTGVGADGIIVIHPSDKADFRMAMYNADGSEGKMCGNGSRCIAKYVYDNGLTEKRRITLETLAGIKVLDIVGLDDHGKVDLVTVDMGEPVLAAAQVPAICKEERMIAVPMAVRDTTVRVTAVSMGNPHGVIFVPRLADIDVHGLGRVLETSEIFPDRANIEFVEVEDLRNLRMRVWERGSGETMACGTGACATLVAAVLNGLTGRQATVHLLGGDLSIRWDEADNHVYMTGPARTVFHGQYQL